MDCPKCGAKNLTDTEFCPFCGFSLEIDKKLEELGEKSENSNRPPPTAMCYYPTTRDPLVYEWEWEEHEKKAKKKRLRRYIALIILGFILLLGIIL